MPPDMTRRTDDHRQGYRGVAAQQGRVILDRDLNALQDVLAGELQAGTRDIVGLSGTPDNGFAISVPPSASLARLRPARAPSDLGFVSIPPPPGNDFLIGPGTMYVSGLRAHFAAPAMADAPISYFNQPDWLTPAPPAPVPPQLEFVWLELTRQQVGAVEDDDLREVALGGPDTTARTRLVQRVRRAAVAHADCAAALQDAQASWAAAGMVFDPATLRLSPQLRLRVGFSDVQAAENPCEPAATGGYLGADNQLIRVMITGPRTLAWGYDNASFLYSVKAQPDRVTLRLDQVPVDAYHRPARNQAVEVLRGAAVLPNGAVMAGATGRITRLTAPYNGEQVAIADPLTDAEAADPHLFLRIWQEATSFTPGQPQSLGATGLTVTFEVPSGAASGAALSVGAFWMIAVRPSTPQQVYPRDLLQDFQPAHGPERWVCPLAVIDWTAPQAPLVTDCRAVFDNLVELTRRRLGGCCTITLRPADLAGQPPVAVIDRLIAASGIPAAAATVCFAAGTYSLTKPLHLTKAHRGLTMAACGGPVTLTAADETDPDFLDGLVVLEQASGITLRGITLQPPAVPFARAVLARNQPGAAVLARIAGQWGSPVGMVGVRLLMSTQVRIVDCVFAFPDPLQADPFAVGVFPSGDCRGLVVSGCSFSVMSPFVVERPRVDTRGRPVFTRPPAGEAVRPAVLAAVANARLDGPENHRFVARFGVAWVVAVGFADQQERISEQIVLPARIDDLAITDCRFDGITAALAGIADTGTVRLRGNTVVNCFAGFWLDSPGLGAAMALDTLAGNFGKLQSLLVTSTPDPGFGLGLALFYPLPVAATLRLPDVSEPPQVLISDNLLSALPPGSGEAGPALLVLTGSKDGAFDPAALVTASGNQASSRAAGVATGVFVGMRGGLTITGSLYANAGPAQQLPGQAALAPPCLHMEVAVPTPAGAGVAATLAVTGNTLRGSANFAENPRGGIAPPLDTWAFANATSQ